MGFGSILKAVLRLDTRQFTKAAKKGKQDLKGIGKQAKDTSDSAVPDLKKIGVGVIAIGAAAIAAAQRIEGISVAIAKAEADISRFQENRLGGAASATNTQAIRDLLDVSPRGTTESQVLSEAHRQAGRFALTSAEDATRIATASRVAFTDSPFAVQEQIREITQRTAGAFKTSGEDAGELLKSLRVAGAVTPEQQAIKQAQVGAAARTSFLTVGNVAEIFNRAAGVGLTQQLGDDPIRAITLLGTRFAPSSAGSPRLAAQSVKDIFKLTLNKTPAVLKALSEAGEDPNTLDPRIISRVLGEKLQRVPEFQIELKNDGFQTQLIQQLQKGFGEIGERAVRVAGEAFDAGSVGTVQSDLEARQRDPNVIRRAAEFKIAAAELQPAEQGTITEAVGINRVLTAEILDRPGTQQDIDTLVRGINREQPGFFDPDKAFDQAQAKRLFVLNSIYPGLDAQLRRISTRKDRGFGPNLRSSFTDVGNQAEGIRRRLLQAKDAANTTRIIGEQADQVDAFENVTNEALAFIRRVETGKSITAEDRVDGKVVASRKVSPSGAERQTASQAEIQGVDLTESVGERENVFVTENNQIKVVNQNGPESKTQNTTSKATTQPSGN